ncbi:MAG TPA: hypothetical protein VHL78_06480 [Actinomycetota bacterium]|nr:hypothetical protein [Actinomycetota bacterium]
MARRNAFRMLLVALATLAIVAPAPVGAAIQPPAEAVDAVAALVSGDARIVELKAPRPEWFTPQLERRVARRGVVAAPVDAPLPGQVGIRPGSWMVSPFWCTMNFIFQKSSTVAIGTAGHCLESGEPVVLLTVAPTGGNPVLVQLGRILLRRDGGIGKDYGLVEVPLARRQWVFPTIAGVAGPCGVYTGGDPQPVAHYGHGLVVGTGGTPRAGQGVELPQVRGFELEWDQDSFAWAGALAPGDSGSAVRIGQLPAVGNLTHGIGVLGLPTPSPIGWGTRVTTVTSGGWQVVNSPLCI